MPSSTHDSVQPAHVAGATDDSLAAPLTRAAKLKRWAMRTAIALFLSLLWLALFAQPTTSI